MSNIWEGIYDDADEYLALCIKFNETPEYVNGFPCSYGKHGFELKRRAREVSQSKLEEEIGKRK